MNKLLFVSAAVGVVVGACRSLSAPEGATLDFALVAPLCSSVIAAEFSIDGMAIGADTFRVNLPEPHIVSRGFTVAPGAHKVSARVPGGYVWPDTQMTFVDGRTFTDSLPFYCS